MRRCIGVHCQATFLAWSAETVIDALQFSGSVDDRVSHRHGPIRLVVGEPRGARNQRQRDHLSNEDNAVARRLARPAPYIKPQVDFLEVPMKEGGHAEDVGVEKKKSDEANEMTPILIVELSSFGNEGTEHRRIHLEIEQGQIAPLGGQESPRHSSEAPTLSATFHPFHLG